MRLHRQLRNSYWNQTPQMAHNRRFPFLVRYRGVAPYALRNRLRMNREHVGGFGMTRRSGQFRTLAFDRREEGPHLFDVAFEVAGGFEERSDDDRLPLEVERDR